MYTYPESMVDKTTTDYKKMEEGGTTNPLFDDQRETSTAERSRSTEVTIPAGLSERLASDITESPKFVFKPGVKKGRCREIECTISKIIFVFSTILLLVILSILAVLYLTGTRLD